ncbi:MAG: YheU family protein [Oligoflexales bacterium]|nr:YheU family protein [Oligoflexales bacterium]
MAEEKQIVINPNRFNPSTLQNIAREHVLSELSKNPDQVIDAESVDSYTALLLKQIQMLEHLIVFDPKSEAISIVARALIK